MIRSVIKYFLSVCLFGLGLGQVDYNTQIQTIFGEHCINCHGSAGGLNLTSYADLMNGGNDGAVITPYDHTTSELYIRITLPSSSDADMPPQGSLSQDEIDLIAQWIDEGALPSGCTDPEAYNCEESMAGEYINEIGIIVYDYSCDGNPDHAGTEDCNAAEICEGYYNPEASTDDGSCRYPQAPHGDEVVFGVEENGISVDWSAFDPPENAVLESYHVQRCLGDGCTWMPGFTNNPMEDPNTSTSLFDDFDGDGWEAGVEIKYAIAVKYSNNPYWGWAIGASYITPCNIGDLNGDGGWNVLDIVSLANCVLADSCDDATAIGCAADVNGDGGWNVLDIVTLANCVLADSCG